MPRWESMLAFFDYLLWIPARENHSNYRTVLFLSFVAGFPNERFFDHCFSPHFPSKPLFRNTSYRSTCPFQPRTNLSTSLYIPSVDMVQLVTSDARMLVLANLQRMSVREDKGKALGINRMHNNNERHLVRPVSSIQFRYLIMDWLLKPLSLNNLCATMLTP